MKRILVPALALLASQFAFAANSVLTYTGNSFNEAYEGAGNVTARFEFASAPVAGTTLTGADLINFSVSSLGSVISNTDASFTSFKFVIGQNGLPTAWNIAVEKNFTGDSTMPEQFSSFNGTGDWSTLDAYSRDDTKPGELAVYGTGYSVIWNSPGTWTASTVAAVPEPSSLAMMTLGACAMLGVRRRAKKTAAA